MHFDWVSDLHVKHWRPSATLFDWFSSKNPEAKVLVIGGDAANNPADFVQVAREAAEHYECVLLCDGNHEHYSSRQWEMETDDAVLYMKAECDKLDRVLFFDGSTQLNIDGTLFVGCNGWYDFRIIPEIDREISHDAWRRGSNDPRCIRFSQYPDKLAESDAEALRRLVLDAQGDPEISEIVVFSHTCPVLKGLRRSADPGWENLTGAYGNSLMQRVLDVDVENKIRVWLFGHTHFPTDFEYQGVRFAAHPRGYPAEHADDFDYRPLLVDTTLDLHVSAFDVPV